MQDGDGSAKKAQQYIFAIDSHAPFFADSALLSVSIAENTTIVANVAANDIDNGDGLSYSLSGADAALFTIDSAGNINFITAPDYENPADFGANNVYDLSVVATDSSGLFATRDVAITVANSNEVTNYSKVNDEFLVNSETVSDQHSQSVATLSNGNFVLTWYTGDVAQDGSSSAINAQLFHANGTKFGAEFLVNSQTAGGQHSPNVVALGNGGFIITWDSENVDGNATGITAQIFDEIGGKQGNEFIVNSQTLLNQNYSKVTSLADGGFVITWQSVDPGQDGSGWAIKAQVFNADGSSRGNEFLVNNKTNSNQSFQEVIGLENGTFIIVWETADGTQDGSEHAVKAGIFNSDGVAVASEFLVNSNVVGVQYDPSIANLTNGNFIVTWTTFASLQDGSGFAIKGQIFDINGATVGNEFLVNSFLDQSQKSSSVTGLSDGSFVITWVTRDASQDVDKRAIKAQVFNSDGSKNGEEFLVNSEYVGAQHQPTISSLPESGFVIVWYTTDSNQDGSG